MRKVNFIAALDDKDGIAIGGKIPWNLPSDQQYFQDYLKEGSVLMGWNTFQANGFKPFGQGKNTVVTHTPGKYHGVEYTNDLQSYFQETKGDIWVAGGGEIFKQSLPYATHLYITRVNGDYGCDTFFPEFVDKFHRVDHNLSQTENGLEFTFQIWELN